MVTITVQLPETLAKQAENAGLLEDETIAALLTAELARKQAAADKLVEMLRKLHAVQPPLTPEEIDAEIAAYRAEKAAARKSDASK